LRTFIKTVKSTQQGGSTGLVERTQDRRIRGREAIRAEQGGHMEGYKLWCDLSQRKIAN
jgi:hypothetical protein